MRTEGGQRKERREDKDCKERQRERERETEGGRETEGEREKTRPDWRQTLTDIPPQVVAHTTKPQTSCVLHQHTPSAVGNATPTPEKANVCTDHIQRQYIHTYVHAHSYHIVDAHISVLVLPLSLPPPPPPPPGRMYVCMYG